MSTQFESWQQMAKPCVIIRKIHGPKETLSGHQDDHKDALSGNRREALGERYSERAALGERHSEKRQFERGTQREALERETQREALGERQSERETLGERHSLEKDTLRGTPR